VKGKKFLGWGFLLLTLFRPGFEKIYSGRGGEHPPWKIDLGVSDPNSFINSQLYIYKEHISKRTGV
jgi:hypothetical protein